MSTGHGSSARPAARARPRGMLGQRGQRRAAAQQKGKRGEMRGRRLHATLQAHAVQHFVHHADEAARRHQHVFTAHELFDRQRLLATPQAGGIEQAGIASTTRQRLAQGSAEPAGRDHQIGLARHQHVRRHPTVRLPEDHAQAGRFDGQPVHDVPPQRNLEIVGQSQRDRAARHARAAWPRQRQALATLVQRLADHGPQFARPQTRGQPAAGTGE